MSSCGFVSSSLAERNRVESRDVLVKLAGNAVRHECGKLLVDGDGLIRDVR